MSKKESVITTLGADNVGTQGGDILEDMEAAPAHVVHAANHDAQLSGKKVRMTVFEQEGVVGKEAVFVSVNGYAYQIPRGIPVEVPEEVANIIQSAKYTTYEAVEGGGHRERAMHRFAFANHGPVTA